jgi:hypothetical protein
MISNGIPVPVSNEPDSSFQREIMLVSATIQSCGSYRSSIAVHEGKIYLGVHHDLFDPGHGVVASAVFSTTPRAWEERVLHTSPLNCALKNILRRGSLSA